jgi:hypothetical protein
MTTIRKATASSAKVPDNRLHDYEDFSSIMTDEWAAWLSESCVIERLKTWTAEKEHLPLEKVQTREEAERQYQEDRDTYLHTVHTIIDFTDESAFYSAWDTFANDEAFGPVVGKAVLLNELQRIQAEASLT